MPSNSTSRKALSADIAAVTLNDASDTVGPQVNPEDIPSIARRHAARMFRDRARHYAREGIGQINLAELEEIADGIENGRIS